MKYDKETIIIMVVCMIMLLAWPYLFYTPQEETTEPETAEVETAAPKTPVPEDASPQTPDSEEKAPARDDAARTEEPPPSNAESRPPLLEPVTIENDLERVTFDLNRGCVSSIVLKKHQRSDEKRHVELLKDLKAGALGISSSKPWVPLETPVWERTATTLTLTRRLKADGAPFELRQSWALEENYQIAYVASMNNTGDAPVIFDDLRVGAGGMPPLRPLAGDQVRRDAHNVDYCLSNENRVISVGADDDPFPEAVDGTIKWISVSNKYFACMLFPKTFFDDGAGLDRETRYFISKDKAAASDRNAEKEEYFLVSADGRYGEVSVRPGEERTWSFTYYAGSKEVVLLEMLDPKASEIMRLAWFSWLEWISQFLLKALIFLKGYCGSYGLSIIALTLIVRCLFWPVTQKANASMKKMQKIQPKIQELRERYKDKPQELNRRMMQLYKEEKVNPLGGCLPIFLQIPVFFALYSTLDGSIELRHTPFLWAQDLSRADTIGHIFGLAINPLIVLMTVTMLIQQYLTPMAGDPMQRKMMMFMPLIMLFLLYSLPSGLTLYWTVSQVFSIIQLLINRKLSNDEEKTVTAKT